VLYADCAKSQSYHHVVFNENNGFNRYYVNDIVRDSSGFYWMATEKGIIRYDGANFIEILAGGQILQQNVRKLTLYKQQLFLIYEKGNALQLDINSLKVKSTNERNIDDILPVDDSTVFMLRHTGELLRYTNGRKTALINLNKKSIKYSDDLNGLLYQWGDLIILSLPSLDVSILHKKNLTIVKEIGRDEAILKKEFNTAGHSIPLLIGRILYQLDSKLELSMIKRESGQEFIKKMQVLPDGTYYYIYRNTSLFSVNAGKHTSLLSPELKNVELRSIYVQDAAHILIGTNAGLVQLIKSPISSISDEVNKQEDKLRIRRKIIPIGVDSLLLIGHPYNYLYTSNKIIRKLYPKMATAYDGLLVGNTLFISTEDNGFQMVNLKARTLRLIGNQVGYNRQFYSLCFNKRDSIVFAAFDDSVLVYHYKTGMTYAAKCPTNKARIKIMIHDEKNRQYWFGTENGLFRTDETLSPKHAIEIKSLRGYTVNDLLLNVQTADLWIAHNSGLERLYTKTLIFDSTDHNLFSGYRIVSLLMGKKNRIWMGTYTGLIGYDPQSKQSILIQKNNGLLNHEFNYKSAAVLHNGNLIFGGTSGYDVIYPDVFNMSKPQVNGLVTGYTIIRNGIATFHAIEKSDELNLVIDTEKESLRIYLSTKETIGSSNFSYQYRVNMGQWLNLNRETYISFFNLEPGTYKIEARAVNNTGAVFNFQPFKVIAKVPFYKSNIFLYSLALFSIFSLFAIVGVIQFNQRKQAAIKEAISMDLHDEIGTILTRALYVSQSNTFPEKDKHVTTYLGEALYGLRVYIKTMQFKNINLGTLVSEIREVFYSQFLAMGYQLKVNLNGLENIEIKNILYRNVKLIFYEIMNNTLKHAQGNLLTITFSQEKKRLIIFVIDNGKLKNLALLEGKGYGIKNMKKRIEKYDGNIELNISESGSGLSIKIELPLLN
jgi:signal transduction histidine kinase